MKIHYPSDTHLAAPVRLLLLLLCCYIPSVLATEDDWHFSDVDRIVAVSDIHGAYDAVVATFQRAGILDDALAWSGGETHLVITGDLLDRGPGSRKVMDLIMRLEKESMRAGGRVHQLLGNHEVMNLIGDVRYVADEEYAAFSDDESAEEREYWYRQFRRNRQGDLSDPEIETEFNRLAPKGFFGHRRAFRNDGLYGSWLLTKPLMIVINETAFVHGGAPPYVAENGLEGINGKLKQDLSGYLSALVSLEDASILSPIDRFKAAPAILEEKLAAGLLDGEHANAAQTMLELRKSPLHGSTGPLWYRGTAFCNPLIEGDVLNAALERIGANRIVFGHTPTNTRKIQQRMNGRIIEIDTGMLKKSYDGSGNALILEEDGVNVANQHDSSGLTPIAHPLGVGTDSELIDDKTLINILTNGTVVESFSSGPSWKLMQVAAFDKTIFAYFNPLPDEVGLNPEIAAYRLDRLLGLYMVPVTVVREVGGQPGTLQYVPLAAINEFERVTTGRGNRAICSMDKQSGGMQVFDALINNPVRTPATMLYGPEDYQLMLVDHRYSFDARAGRPAHLTDVELRIGNEWREALRAVDDEQLAEHLGDVLDTKRLKALANRRDTLLDGANR